LAKIPIYEYRCPNCYRVYSSTFISGAECPECGETGKRKYSPPTVIFKGSGFYKTDYK
jgi:putative FmdB family regulatory protein